MASDSHNSEESGDASVRSLDDHVDLATARKLERFVVAAAIVGPVLLGILQDDWTRGGWSKTLR